MRSFPCLDHQIVECYSTYSQKSMFENRPKSRNQQCEGSKAVFEYVQYLAHVIITMRTICYCFVNRSKLGRVNELIRQIQVFTVLWSILATFWKLEVYVKQCYQTGHFCEKCKNSKCDILSNFQTLWTSVFLPVSTLLENHKLCPKIQFSGGFKILNLNF